MDKSSVETIVAALNRHRVQYLIAGGMAVVAHGYVRFTADVDLLLAMDEANLRCAVAAVIELGYQPRAPVAMEDFLDAENRRRWMRDKGMMVFSLFSPKHPATEIDLFVENPLDFPVAYGRAVKIDVAPNVTATFCGLEDLIAMKTRAGRSIDKDDIQRLMQIKR